MSSSLRDEIAAVTLAFVEESKRMGMPKLTESRRLKLADRILAIPAIAEALKAREHILSLAREVEPDESKNVSLTLGHSIGVRRDSD